MLKQKTGVFNKENKNIIEEFSSRQLPVCDLSVICLISFFYCETFNSKNENNFLIHYLFETCQTSLKRVHFQSNFKICWIWIIFKPVNQA
jgi:hypothetical protein